MLTHDAKNVLSRNRRRSRKLWHDSESNTPSLDCRHCPEWELCGGLRIKASLYNCLRFCCGIPESCDRVCRNNPDFVRRVREVRGFSFDTIPRAESLPAPALPSVIPIFFHGNRREVAVTAGAAGLSLYQTFRKRDGALRFNSHGALCTTLGIKPGTPLVLSGTDRDPPLERWWGLGESRRRDIIRSLRDLGVVLATTPNYSLFLDRPRQDDLHAVKRIAIVHEEFLSEGLPAALHVNGRTDTDFRRWASYITGRPEITHLAYEFTTGTAWAGRREQHASWLSELAATVGRPLDLVVRGGTEVLPILSASFSRVSILDTSVFMKTMMRQRAVPAGNARISWQPSPTEIGSPLDELFAENLLTIERWLSNLIAPGPAVLHKARA